MGAGTSGCSGPGIALRSPYGGLARRGGEIQRGTRPLSTTCHNRDRLMAEGRAADRCGGVGRRRQKQQEQGAHCAEHRRRHGRHDQRQRWRRHSELDRALSLRHRRDGPRLLPAGAEGAILSQEGPRCTADFANNAAKTCWEPPFHSARPAARPREGPYRGACVRERHTRGCSVLTGDPFGAAFQRCRTCAQSRSCDAQERPLPRLLAWRRPSAAAASTTPSTHPRLRRQRLTPNAAELDRPISVSASNGPPRPGAAGWDCSLCLVRRLVLTVRAWQRGARRSPRWRRAGRARRDLGA